MSTPAPAAHPFTVPKDQVLRLCFLAGAILQPHLSGCVDAQGDPLNGARLMWTIAGCESTWGADCTPRYERAYAPGGLYYKQSAQQRELWRLFNLDAARSFGPWQILPCNAAGFTPEELGRDAEKAALATQAFIRRYVIGAKGARKLEDILDTYNSGTWRDEVTERVQRYIARGLHFYLTEVIDHANPANPLG